MMKKIMAFTLLLTLIISFGACGHHDTKDYAMVTLPDGEVVTGECAFYTTCYNKIEITFKDGSKYFTDVKNVVIWTEKESED